MEGNSRHTLVGSIVVLDKSFATDVPDFDCFIRRACRNARSIWMELHAVDRERMVSKGLDQGLSGDVPKFNLLVL